MLVGGDGSTGRLVRPSILGELANHARSQPRSRGSALAEGRRMIRPRMFPLCLSVFAITACAASATGDDDDDKGDGLGSSPGHYIRYEKFNAMTTDAAPTGSWKTTGSALVRE